MLCSFYWNHKPHFYLISYTSYAGDWQSHREIHLTLNYIHLCDYPCKTEGFHALLTAVSGCCSPERLSCRWSTTIWHQAKVSNSHRVLIPTCHMHFVMRPSQYPHMQGDLWCPWQMHKVLSWASGTQGLCYLVMFTRAGDVGPPTYSCYHVE